MGFSVCVCVCVCLFVCLHDSSKGEHEIEIQHMKISVAQTSLILSIVLSDQDQGHCRPSKVLLNYHRSYNSTLVQATRMKLI